MSKKRICIIGGGFTGLTIAYELSKEKSFKIEVVEAGPFLGGLASGFTIEGANIEKTYHHLFKSDKSILNFCKEIGIEDKLVWNPSSVAIFEKGKLYPFSSPFDLLKFKPIKLHSRILIGLSLLYLKYEKNWKNFVDISAIDWLKKWTKGDAVENFWKLLLKGKFGEYYDKVSMAWLWARFHIRLNSKEKGDAREMLGYFDGGFNVVVETLTKKLIEAGVSIKLNSKVEYIQKQGDIFDVKINNDVEKFDKVVATIPSGIFSRLIEKNAEISKEYLMKLNSIKYIGAITTVFSSEQNLGQFYWYNIHDEDIPFLVFINHTNFIDKSKYNGKYVYYIGAYLPHEHKYFEAAEEEILRDWFDGLAKIFPEFDQGQIREKHLFKFKNAQHIVDKNYVDKIPEYETPLKGLYLSNFSQIFPEDRGTNYAVREGIKIAKKLNS